MTGGRPYDAVKRAFDIAAAVCGLIVAAPVMGVVAAVVAVRLGRPVLFRQQRPGRRGEIFTLVKFRSMLPESAPGSDLHTDSKRLTPFGRRLRATSLDELPTLWNVLRGDMSFIGPRPLHVRYLERYSATQARRHEVRPGVTGLAQVSGRNALDWGTRLALDVVYVDNRSLALDLAILGKTFGAVVRREGISENGHVTMSEFMGAPDMTVHDQPGFDKKGGS